VNHQEALRCSAVEKYLLKEMPDPERDEFEEHFFGCQECAADLKTTAAFLEAARREMRRSAQPAPGPGAGSAPVPRSARKLRKVPWFEFLWRPAFAAPAFALLLAVVVYQNVAVLPRVAGESAQREQPEILTSLSLIGGNSRGGEVPTVSVAKAQPLLISLDIPAAERFSSYTCVLIDSSGRVLWRLPVSPAQAKDTVAIRVPAGLVQRGDYRLVVRGQAVSGGEPTDLATYRFTLNRSI